jgi:uncharacterized protein YjiS (DUF1127 family)
MSNLFSGSVHALAARFAEWRSRQRAYAELSALEDRDLADIGISRSEIPYILAQADDAPIEHPAGNRGHDFQHAA